MIFEIRNLKIKPYSSLMIHSSASHYYELLIAASTRETPSLQVKLSWQHKIDIRCTYVSVLSSLCLHSVSFSSFSMAALFLLPSPKIHLRMMPGPPAIASLTIHSSQGQWSRVSSSSAFPLPSIPTGAELGCNYPFLNPPCKAPRGY